MLQRRWPPVKAGFRGYDLLRLSALQAKCGCPCNIDQSKTAQKRQEHQELALICSKLFVIKYFIIIQMF